MEYNQNELELLMDALAVMLERIMEAQLALKRRALRLGASSKGTLRDLTSYGETIRSLRLELPLAEEDWDNIHSAVHLFLEECLLLPEELGLARVWTRRLESLRALRQSDPALDGIV